MNIAGLVMVSLGVITLLHINSVDAPLSRRDTIVLWTGLAITAVGLVISIVWPS